MDWHELPGRLRLGGDIDKGTLSLDDYGGEGDKGKSCLDDYGGDIDKGILCLDDYGGYRDKGTLFDSVGYVEKDWRVCVCVCIYIFVVSVCACACVHLFIFGAHRLVAGKTCRRQRGSQGGAG